MRLISGHSSRRYFADLIGATVFHQTTGDQVCDGPDTGAWKRSRHNERSVVITDTWGPRYSGHKLCAPLTVVLFPAGQSKGRCSGQRNRRVP